MFVPQATINERCAPLHAMDIEVRNLSGTWVAVLLAGAGRWFWTLSLLFAVVTPAGRQLAVHVSFGVTAGHPLIIMGPSGA